MSSNQSLFTSNINNNPKAARGQNKAVTRASLKDDYPNTNSELSWEYDNPGSGIKSTQQLKVDWTNFSEHTFFHSAEVKVNAAYERLINHFPYDGSAEEVEEFVSSLNGWEHHVLDMFPKYIGYLNFNSSIFISIKDSQGYLFPALAKKNTLKSIIGAGSSESGYTFECFYRPPDDSTTVGNQILFQKLSTDGNTGITIAVSGSADTANSVEVHSILSSGSGDNVYTLHTSASINKGKFSHISTVYDKYLTNTLSILKNGVLQDTSTSRLEINNLNFVLSDITIGSGSNHATGSTGFENGTFWAQTPLTGALDEIRFWTQPKNHTLISSSIEHSAKETDNLGIYLKFNEPTGSYNSSNIVLDSSGNGLHGYITNYNNSRRIIEDTIPLKYENPKRNPVLFPDYPTLTAKNVALLVTASNYDVINPNYILKLIPKHYLEADSVQPVDPSILPEYTSSVSVPGGGKMPSNQIIAQFLFVWAAFFDDIKMHIDSVKDIQALNYKDINGIPDQAIKLVAKQYGYDLPNIFADATPGQFHLGKNLTKDEVYGEKSLKTILHSMWRRVTAEIPNINRAKGTIASIKMMLNSFGIDAESNFRIREFGSNPIKTVQSARKEKSSALNFINFNTGSSMYMSSSNLLAYRWAPGYPLAHGEQLPTYNIAGNAWSSHPRLVPLTSGSWSFEGRYKINKSTQHATQSLVRLDLSASNGTTSPFMNVLAYSGSSYHPEDYRISVVMSLSGASTPPGTAIDLELPSVNMYGGDYWHIAVTSKQSAGSAQMTLSAINANGSRIYQNKSTSSYYTLTDAHPLKSYMRTPGAGSAPADDRTEDDVPFLSFGSQTGYQNKHLGNNTPTNFNGSISAIRFWSKALTNNEISDHALNPFSIGSANPVVNSPFLKIDHPSLGVTGSHAYPNVNPASGQISLNSGSWERLRLIGDIINSSTSSDAAGTAAIVDLSRNAYNLGITNAAASSQIISPAMINYSVLETNWDNPSVTNKVRVRSYQDAELANSTGAVVGKLTNLDPREKVADDKRFAIEASVSQAINEDISNLISDLFFLNNSIGAPEMLFSINYPDLDSMADTYFNRLEDKVDFKNYFEFFKWFDLNFSSMIENLIPSTTEYLGAHFVIESHVLERHKLQYQQADVHIDLSRRLAARIENYTDCTITT
tara:strand:+ start:9734 stop:13222 length:3489 start_codon:yes stop_codon:yes gene_type:complete